jgi:hypothetical protein
MTRSRPLDGPRQCGVDMLSRERLVDQLIEAYVDWRETCARVGDAYRFWAIDGGCGGRIAFGSYVAALDAEERSADVYAGIVRRADARAWSERSPAEPRGGR